MQHLIGTRQLTKSTGHQQRQEKSEPWPQMNMCQLFSVNTVQSINNPIKFASYYRKPKDAKKSKINGDTTAQQWWQQLKKIRRKRLIHGFLATTTS
jgi:hypothetical protein